MNSLWWTCMIILLVVFFITCFVLCKAFLRDFKEITRLTSPVYPEIVVVPVVDLIDEGNLPITNGVLVNDINEDLQIVDIQQVIT